MLLIGVAEALDPGEKCQLQKLKALRGYANCFLKSGRKQLKKALTVTEHDALLDACDENFKANFEKAVATAAKKGASCADDAAEVLEAVRESLTNAEVVASSKDPNCTKHGSTQRCVFQQSHLPWDMKTWVDNNFDDQQQGELLITAEAWGAKGQGPDGAKGGPGYAQTTWTFLSFGESTDLYIYVGKQPSCSSCGGSSSMILFNALEEIGGLNDMLLVAGGGGGGVENGGEGGDGGRVVASLSRESAPGGGGNQGGNPNGNGQGGSGNSDCRSTAGTAGIGGYGGIKQNNQNSDRAGWRNTDSPSFSDYDDGSGGIGESADSSSGAGPGGGGGYGGGGGNCAEHGGGGGGSVAAALQNDASGTAQACGSADEKPDSNGSCGKGGENGVVALNFEVAN